MLALSDVPVEMVGSPLVPFNPHHHLLFQLSNEETIKNITHWTLFNYYNSSSWNESFPRPPLHPADVPRGSCWETAVGIVSSPALLKRSSSFSILISSLTFPLLSHQNIQPVFLRKVLLFHFPIFLSVPHIPLYVSFTNLISLEFI